MSENNPFAPLEEQLRKQDLEQRAARLLTKVRSFLLLGKRFEGDTNSKEAMGATVFFSTIALRMEPVVDWKEKTLATDGKRLIYNPEFLCWLGLNYAIGVVTHEAMHVANKHHCRMGSRDVLKWNVACDAVVNGILLNSGFQLPGHIIVAGKRPDIEGLPEEWKDAIAKLPTDGSVSAEEVYALLPEPQQGKEAEGQGKGQGAPGGQQGGQGKGEEEDEGQGEGQCPDPGGCGGVIKPGDGSPSAERQAEAETEVLVAQAQQAAQQRGTLPAGIARLVQQALTPTVDWRQVLREFVSRYARNDFSWARPNRRFIHAGLYLPGMHSEELGDVLVAVDTSGSIGERVLAQFAGELQSILENFDCSLTIVYHDSAVAHVQHWQSSDGPLVLEPQGGGGTDHRPVFAWVEEQGLSPECMVCLTDMMSRFPDCPPDYPVLWASTIKGAEAPFGQLVEVKIH